jgi:hypothetical protein
LGLGAIDASLKFVAHPFDLADQQKLVPARYPDQKMASFSRIQSRLRIGLD